MFPDFGGDMIIEMQREKERLHKQMITREKSHKLYQEQEQRIKEMLTKKEIRSKKHEDKLKQDMKLHKRKLESQHYKSEEKKNQQELSILETYNEADQLYMKYLEEIKQREEVQKRKEKNQCEFEYKRYNEQFTKSMYNYDTYIKSKREQDKTTAKNLNNLQKRLNDGYSRSVQRKEEVRLSAVSISQKLDDVVWKQRQKKQSVENENLIKFLETKTKFNKQIQNWEKSKEKSFRMKRYKNLDKLSQIKLNLSDVYEDRQRWEQQFMEKQEKIEQNLSDTKEKRLRAILMRHERENLKMIDQKKNLEKVRNSMVSICMKYNDCQGQQKQRVFDKHMKIDETLQKVKVNKEHLIEYSRIANEIRLQKIPLTQRS